MKSPNIMFQVSVISCAFREITQFYLPLLITVATIEVHDYTQVAVNVGLRSGLISHRQPH